MHILLASFLHSDSQSDWASYIYVAKHKPIADTQALDSVLSTWVIKYIKSFTGETGAKWKSFLFFSSFLFVNAIRLFVKIHLKTMRNIFRMKETSLFAPYTRLSETIPE